MAQSMWVLIAAAGKPELLGRTLRSLAACHKPATYRGTVIVENGPVDQVLDNPSHDYTRRLLADLPSAEA